MISHKVLPIIELRAENENEDDVEVLAAIKTLQTSLSQIFEDMSSFDEYASEVRPFSTLSPRAQLQCMCVCVCVCLPVCRFFLSHTHTSVVMPFSPPPRICS